ncbi:MAG TPA: type II and III secretion system protein family protein [Alphaproteobacteria bacterium]|jgi:pilus assembly protein CpaC|nr:type II and III secretion system protein family protein [Alphaproteobacteria bacterium]
MRHNFFWIALVCAAVLNVVFVVPALAGAQVIGPASSQIGLEVGKGNLIRLDSPAASVFVADPKIADIQVKSPTLVYVVGKAPGQTTLFAVNEHDVVLANMGISVHFDETALRQDLKRFLPASNIDVSTANNTLVLSGSAASAADSESAKTIAARFAPDIEHIVNAMQVDAPNQVNLRVRIAEVSRDIIKQFGFNWGSGGYGPGHFQFGMATGRGALSTAAGGSLQPNVTESTSVDSLFAAFATQHMDLNVLIDALDNEGLVSVLAEPNLTAVSGAPASFLAGGEFPIPVPQGLNVTTIDYKKFGVSLSFVATITDGGRINLVVKPEVSELSTDGAIEIGGTTVPSLTTRRTETTVDLASGQSFAIAGLLQNNVTQNIQKFPGLGSVPVLGALFRSDKFERNESELVIIVTPYVVHPSSDRRLAAPTDGYIAPTDGQRIIAGADYTPTLPPRRTAQPSTRPSHSLIGPVGFDLQ